jgi:protein-serine/threonine kinase
MIPHRLPGVDLFDYIKVRANMDESGCRDIFKQVVGTTCGLAKGSLLIFLLERIHEAIYTT